MAEEVKQEAKSENAKKTMATVFKVIVGLVLLGAGFYVGIFWWLTELKTLIKACIGPFLVLAGIITLAIAKE
jgi:cell division septal protein FtsQ